MPRSILQRLHDSEISGDIYWLYGSPFSVRIGSPPIEEATVGSWTEVEEWLRQKAVELYPESNFAKDERAIASPRPPSSTKSPR